MLPYHTPLSLQQQSALGVDTPAPVARLDRVHHDDLDALMHVNNTRYLVWFERLRIHFMEHYGIGTLGCPEDPRVVIRSGEMHWVAEMLRAEDYVTTARCVAMRRTSLSLEQTIYAAGSLRARFTCVMVLLQPDGSARLPIPARVRAHLAADGALEDKATVTSNSE